MNILKKTWKFLSSMRFAIILLLVLAAACSLGSFITQGQSYSWYAQRYSQRTAGLILALHLDDAFHSWWFILITGFLCVNLLLCNVTRLPALIRRTRAWREPPRQADSAPLTAQAADPRPLFGRLRMPAPAAAQTESGARLLYSSRHGAGLWGAWVCHLGVLLLILGFSLGQMTQKQYVVYGVPGQTRPVGDTGFSLTIDRFRIEENSDGTPGQYTTSFTLTGEGIDQSASASVNAPASLSGMKIYQNSTGWAASVSITQGGEPLQSEVVCAGDFVRVENLPDLVIYFNAFYPDYVARPGALPATASSDVNNPAYLYTVYYQDQILGMNALMDGEELTIDDYTVLFSDPQPYTLLEIKVDRFALIALLGGIVTMLGLLLAFYLQPTRLWTVENPDGSWTVCAQCQKGGSLFARRFHAAAGQDAAP